MGGVVGNITGFVVYGGGRSERVCTTTYQGRETKKKEVNHNSE